MPRGGGEVYRRFFKFFEKTLSIGNVLSELPMAEENPTNVTSDPTRNFRQQICSSRNSRLKAVTNIIYESEVAQRYQKKIQYDLARETTCRNRSGQI